MENTKKIYKRKCPNCDGEIVYKRKYNYFYAEKNNSLCNLCCNVKQHNGSYRLAIKEKKYKRNCPDCGEELYYSSKSRLVIAVKKKSKCRSCSHIGNPTSDALKEKRRQRLLGKTYEEIYGKKRAKEIKKNISGKNNSFYKKTHTDAVKKRISEASKLNRLGKYHSDETKRKIRISVIKYIRENKNNGYQFSPNYNRNSIPILEQKAKELGITDLQHAENGGEFYIRDLGYWVDGYSSSKNIVIEYHEPFHKKQIQKDKQRKQEIIKYLNCKFIEIKNY